MTQSSTPNEDLRFLAKLSQRYHRLLEDETGSLFLEELRGIGDDRLEVYRDWGEQYLVRKDEGVLRIRPVVFVRRVVTDRILQGQPVTSEDLQEIQNRVEQRDTEYFADYPEYLEPLANHEIKSRSAFVNWNPFRILFYIDYYHRAEAVTSALARLAGEVESRLSIKGTDRHLAGFNHNQNFGTDWSWLAIYPPAKNDHRDAVQLFIAIRPDVIEAGLASGSRVDFENPPRLHQSHDAIDFSAIIERLDGLQPQFVKANRELAEGERDQTDPGAAGATTAGRHPLNLILYGPPGTGKTHAVRERAVRIVDGSTTGLSAGELNQRFGNLLDEGRVEFLTFHPSYSYEEFVEGLRYDREEKIPILHDGVLKRLAEKAMNPFQRPRAREGARVWKVSLGDSSEQHIFERCMRENHIAVGWLADHDLSGSSPEEISEAVQVGGISAEAGRIKSLNYLVHEMQDGDFVAILESARSIRAIGVVDGPYEYLGEDVEYPHTRPVRWLDREVHDIYEMNDSTRLTLNTIYPLDRIQLDDFLELLPTEEDRFRPHVLIVDEINRGDPARIFGELITLLEPDKRRGARNEVTVRLPYSQDLFRLPANLFVLATMNSTDRSIALMDAALRRRFEFEELRPDVEVIRDSLAVFTEEEESDSEITPEQVELICSVFEVLNDRIAILMDTDHQIGHSYFMGIGDLHELHRRLYRQVLPLLQEYFHGDRDRMTRLLGAYDAQTKTGFVRSGTRSADVGFGGDWLTEADLPWAFHRYGASELEDALRGTFLAHRES